MRHVCAWCPWRSEGASQFLELEFHMVVSHHVGSGNCTRALYKNPLTIVDTSMPGLKRTNDLSHSHTRKASWSRGPVYPARLRVLNQEGNGLFIHDWQKGIHLPSHRACAHLEIQAVPTLCLEASRSSVRGTASLTAVLGDSFQRLRPNPSHLPGTRTHLRLGSLSQCPEHACNLTFQPG